MFRAAASFSGVVHTRLSPDDSEGILDLLEYESADPEALWGDPERDAEVWAAHNPFDLAPGLRGIPLFLSVGNGQPGPLDAAGRAADRIEPGLAEQNAAFAARLDQLGIAAELSFYGPGVHDWPYWQRELRRAWPMLTRALGLG